MNRIKTMNGAAFANLQQLVIVDLARNTCINKLFEIERGSNKFRRKISRSCMPDAVDVKKEISCITSIACDEMQEQRFIQAYGNASGCCELEYGINIDSPDYSFAANANESNLEVLIIGHQQNVEFLPVLVHKRLPGLKVYWIVNTPVPRISKRNFEKLYKLNVLQLDRNRIETIKSDTFEDLTSLKYFGLCKYLQGNSEST